jgi:hypothetical protein
MTEPTEDEVLVKAKQLAHDDGRLWDTEDLEDAPAARDRIADDSPPRRISQPSARTAETPENLNVEL